MACALVMTASARATTTDVVVPPTRIAVIGPPTSVAVSRDGVWLFVALDRHFGDPGGIVALRRRADGSFAVVARADARAGVRDVALSRDGSALAFTTPVGPGIVATEALASTSRTELAVRPDGDLPGTDRIVIAPDGGRVYYTNQRAATLGVARVERDASGAPALEIESHVALDRLPDGLAITADGASLFVASEIDRADPLAVAGASDARLGRTSCAVNRAAHGVLSIVNAARASDDPAHAIRARIAAGCAPARVALAPDGDTAWVTARGDDRVFGFVVHDIVRDPQLALVANVAAGPSPVGIAITPDGTRLAVAASGSASERRSGMDAGVVLIDTAAARRGDVTARTFVRGGARPRDAYASADGTLWVTDYAGRAVFTFAPSVVGAVDPSAPAASNAAARDRMAQSRELK